MSAMTYSYGREGGKNIRGGRGGRSKCPQCSYCKRTGHTQGKSYSLHGFADKAAHVSKFEK